MEDIYSRDNYNISYRRFSSTKTKRRPGRPPAYINEPPVNCFVCDEKITKQKVNLVQGMSHNKNGFPCQISQLLGDEFLIIVQEDDCLCRHCVSLFNSMDKFEKQLVIVKDKLLKYLRKKYNLENNSMGDNVIAQKDTKANKIEMDQEDVDDDIAKQLNELHGNKSKILKCSVCDFDTTDCNKFDEHLREHINTAVETEFSDNSNSSTFDGCFNTGVNNTSPAIKLYKCSICLKVYLSKLKCIEHMKLCHIGAPLSTESSDELFDNLMKNNKSDKTVDKANTSAYNCETCSLSFSNENELCKHSCGYPKKRLKGEVDSSFMGRSRNETPVVSGDKVTCSNIKEIEMEKNYGITDGSVQVTDPTEVGVPKKDGCLPQVSDKGARRISNDDARDQVDDDDDDIGAGDVAYSEGDSASNSDDDSVNSDDEDDDASCEGEPKKHCCGNCGFKGDLVTLKEHFLEARSQRDLVCSVCGQAFNSFCKLISHSSGHNIDSKPIECIYCPNQINLPDLLSLNYHMKKAHLQLVDEKWCNVCDQVFPNLDYLDKHKFDNCCLNKDVEFMDVSQSDENTENLIDAKKNRSPTNIDCKNDQLNSFVTDSNKNCDLVEVNSGENDAEVRMNPLQEEDLHVTKTYSNGNENPNPMFIDTNERFENNSNFSDRSNKNSNESFVFSNNNTNDSDSIQIDSSDAPNDETLSVVYKCGICGEKRNTKDALLIHFEKHNSFENDVDAQKPVCDICDVVFCNDTGLKQHLRKHSAISQNIACLYCKGSFYDYQHLKHHIICNHSHNINNLLCSMCGYKFGSNIGFRNHLITTHKSDGNYFCKKCNQSFNFKYKLYKHYCKHHKNELRCKFCDNISSSLPEYFKHKRSHYKRILNLKCSICSRTFKNINSLKRHRSRHACDLNLFCAACELSFPDVNELNDHMNSSHKGDGSLYCCGKCGKTFTYYDQYRIHRLNHENERSPYECKLCRVKFVNLSLRAIHKRRLHKRKYFAYECNFCNEFRTRDIYFYKRHLFLHVKRFRYHCKTCLKCYTKESGLIKHQYRIHKRIRPYSSFSVKFYKQDSYEPPVSSDSCKNYETMSVVKSSHDTPPLYCQFKNNKTYI